MLIAADRIIPKDNLALTETRKGRSDRPNHSKAAEYTIDMVETTKTGAFGLQMTNALSHSQKVPTVKQGANDVAPLRGRNPNTRPFIDTRGEPVPPLMAQQLTNSSTTIGSPGPALGLVNYGATSPFDYEAAKYAHEHPDDPTGAIQAALKAVPLGEQVKPTNEVDAYWAQFPEEVQALRQIPDRASRIPVARELASRGFSIDDEIMVMGYDPYETMLIRRQLGYTWVPAMGQPFIEVPPGLTFPGKAPYDPNKPPAGSIQVSLDFSIGLEMTSPAMKNKLVSTGTVS